MKLRLVCRTYFEREAERQLIPAEYNNCPIECLASSSPYNPHRSECGECPHRIEREAFKDHATGKVRETMGDVRFDFSAFLPLFYAARNAEDAPREKVTVRLAAFRNVYLSEKRMHEAIKDRAK